MAACPLSQAELVQCAASVGIQEADFAKVVIDNSFKNANLQAMTRLEEMVAAIDVVAVTA